MLYYAVLILFTFYHHLLILIPSFHMNYTIMEFDLLISTMFESTLLFCCFLTSNVTLCGSPTLEVKITGLAVIYRSEPTPRALQLVCVSARHPILDRVCAYRRIHILRREIRIDIVFLDEIVHIYYNISLSKGRVQDHVQGCRDESCETPGSDFHRI